MYGGESAGYWAGLGTSMKPSPSVDSVSRGGQMFVGHVDGLTWYQAEPVSMGLLFESRGSEIAHEAVVWLEDDCLLRH